MLEKISENNERNIEYPTYIYMDISGLLSPLAITLTDRFTQIPQNPTKSLQGDLALKLKNNGRYHCRKKLEIPDILQKIQFQLNRTDFLLLQELSKCAQEKGFSRNEYIETIGYIIKHLHPDNNTWENLKLRMEQILEEEETLAFSSAENRPEIIGAVYHGIFVPFEELHTLKEDIDSKFSLFENVGPKIGEYLYRAVDEREWGNIQINQGYLISLRTQFEDQKRFERQDSQVKHFANQEEYSGKIIRFKVLGPYFMYKGLQNPRVESQCAHFTKVEVFENGSWVEIGK